MICHLSFLVTETQAQLPVTIWCAQLAVLVTMFLPIVLLGALGRTARFQRMLFQVTLTMRACLFQTELSN